MFLTNLYRYQIDVAGYEFILIYISLNQQYNIIGRSLIHTSTSRQVRSNCLRKTTKGYCPHYACSSTIAHVPTRKTNRSHAKTRFSERVRRFFLFRCVSFLIARSNRFIGKTCGRMPRCFFRFSLNCSPQPTSFSRGKRVSH